MSQTYVILSDGGLMTQSEFYRHLKTVKYYNHLVDTISELKKGTEDYQRVRGKIIRSLEYYRSDLIKAQETAKLFKSK